MKKAPHKYHKYVPIPSYSELCEVGIIEMEAILPNQWTVAHC